MATDVPLLMIIERFLRETEMPATKLGRLAVNDPRFVLDLRLGREPGNRVRCRVEYFMSTYGVSVCGAQEMARADRGLAA